MHTWRHHRPDTLHPSPHEAKSLATPKSSEDTGATTPLANSVSADGRQVNWNGIVYRFSPHQGAVVRLLYDHSSQSLSWKQIQIHLHTRFANDAVSYSGLTNLFQGKPGHHAIIERVGPRSYRFAMPSVSPAPTAVELDL